MSGIIKLSLLFSALFFFRKESLPYILAYTVDLFLRKCMHVRHMVLE
jgi:hypothetical protein